MTLIIGGAYQGKAAYARDLLAFPAERIIPAAEQQIREAMDRGESPEAFVLRQAEGPWRDAAVLLAEIGSGVVPMDAGDRAWREAVGRCGALLAARADRVIRVFCGIGTVIKDA